MSGKRAFLELLKQEGVEIVFGNPGTTEPILSADLPTLAQPFVKWADEVRRLSHLPRLVHRAAKTALAPPTGPVFLSLPGDILKDEGEVDLMTPTRIAPRLRGDADAI